MLTKPDPDALGFLLTDVSRLLRAELERRIVAVGIDLTPAEARTLLHAAHAGATRQSLIAERMGVEAMTLSSYLDRLEARALIRREPDPNDRRAKIVQLTEDAEPVLAEIMRITSEMRNDITEQFPAPELQIFRQGLKRLQRTLMDMRPECRKGNSA